MATSTQLSKYLELEYSGFKGMNSQSSSLMLDPGTLAQSSGFMLRDGMLYPQPAFLSANTPGVDLSDGEFILGVKSFVDSNNVAHTVMVSSIKIYQLANPWSPGSYWSPIYTLAIASIQVSFVAFGGILYFSISNAAYNGALYSWDGLSATATLISDTQGAVYLSTIANRLIAAHTFEVTSPYYYPHRIRWSATNSPGVFDPAVNSDAGFVDLLDLQDGISGILCVGAALFILSPRSIRVMTPTGNGALPFTIDNYWNAQYGVGCAFPQSADSYGEFGFFIGMDNVYAISFNGVQSIGDMIKDQLMNLIYNIPLSATQVFLFGRVIPLNINGYINICYNIYLSMTIPLSSKTYVFSYDLNQQLWNSYILNSNITCAPDSIVIG